MAIPSRNDIMIKNLMKRRRSKVKEVKIESKPKNPEDVKKLLEMWQKAKEKEQKKNEPS